MNAAIPEAFIKYQVDTLVEMAKAMPAGPLRDAILLRTDHYMDLVEAYRMSQAKPREKSE
jgi:hypothetical protein